MMLLQELVRHHLQQIGDGRHVPMLLVEELVEINRVRSCTEDDLKAKHWPSVDSLLWLQLFASKTLCFGQTPVRAEGGFFNDAEA
jgi:hypothetical protein